MRRKRTRNKAAAVSLFPFLAVLICTMGAIIVLLVLVVKQADAHARDQRRQHADEHDATEEKLRQELEDQDFLRETLRQRRPAATKRLTDERLKLSHIEDHLRELRESAEKLKQQLADMDQIQASRSQGREAIRAELEKARRAVRVAQAELERAEKKASGRPQSFAVIPYDGPNGTRRRPIYIECTADAVILQPEGIRLRPGDFADPLVPGNPLDAALLAVREYFARTGGAAVHGEPYPLLLVRPGGTLYYHKAREAMKSWEDEFGYELIDADTPLSFPQPNPTLEELLERTIADARVRQTLLAQAQPSRFANGAGGEWGGGGNGAEDDSGITLRAARGGGGFIIEGNDLGEDGSFGSSASRGGSSSDARGFGSGRQGATRNESDNQSAPSDTQNGASATASQGNQPSGTPGSGPGGSAGGLPRELAAGRGAGWALPSRSSGAAAYKRPIRVVVEADRLIIVPQRDSAQRMQIVEMTASTRAAVDPFVSAVWKHMQSWGIAGRNAYWIPVLSVEVAQGGEARYAELDALMRDSGFEINRKTP